YLSERNNDTPGIKVYHKINSVFDNLSLAAVVNGSTFCVHGGISPGLDLDQIQNITKPLQHDQLETKDINGNQRDASKYNSLALNLMWSDPLTCVNEFRPNDTRGHGQFFGPRQVDEFLSAHDLKRIVRAHEKENNGFRDVFGNGRIITLFSAPNYCGEKNKGAIAIIDGMLIRFKHMK
ncbi:MAG: metallophosphoesterase, partial [Oscillospiraceae bacterium]|nr:metallophosphoesterase [Oscillospiraceae bacterium]